LRTLGFASEEQFKLASTGCIEFPVDVRTDQFGKFGRDIEPLDR
jgi:hypothetical protein